MHAKRFVPFMVIELRLFKQGCSKFEELYWFYISFCVYTCYFLHLDIIEVLFVSNIHVLIDTSCFAHTVRLWTWDMARSLEAMCDQVRGPAHCRTKGNERWLISCVPTAPSQTATACCQEFASIIREEKQLTLIYVYVYIVLKQHLCTIPSQYTLHSTISSKVSIFLFFCW